MAILTGQPGLNQKDLIDPMLPVNRSSALLTGKSGIPTVQDYNYITSKVNALNSTNAEGKNTWTYPEVSKAISSMGWTPYDHYANAGKSEGLNWTPNTSLVGMNNLSGIPSNPAGWAGGSSPTKSASQNIFQPDKYQKSYSGIGGSYQKDLMDAMLPQLKASFQNYGSNIDKSTKAANEAFSSMNKKAMNIDLQGILNNLASRGMLNSSVASDTIAKGSAALTGENSGKAFQSAMQNAVMKAEEPTLLAKIASLGSYSESSDPLEPYKLMAQYDWNMS